LVVVPVATVVRLLNINAHAIWYDEGNSIIVAKRLFEPGLFTQGLVATDPILWAALLRAWYTVSDAELWLKMLPMLLSVLSVVAAYFAARRFFSDSARATYVALLIALSPFHVYYGRELRTYALYALTSFMAFYYFTRLRDNERDRTASVGYVLTAAATLYAHYIGLFWIVALFVAGVAVWWGAWRHIVRWIGLNAVTGILCMPGLLCLLVATRVIRKAEWVFPCPGLKSPIITVKNMIVGYTSLRSLYITAALVAAGLVFAALVKLARRRAFSPMAVLLITAGLMPALIFFLSYFTQSSSYIGRNLTPNMLPFFMLICIGTIGCRPEPSRRFRWAQTALAAVPLALMSAGLPSMWADDIHPAHHQRPGVRYKIDNRAVAEYIEAGWQNGDVIGHASHVTLPSMRYYLSQERAGKYVVLTENDARGVLSGYPLRDAWLKSGLYPQRIERCLAETSAKRLWMVVSWWEPFTREHPPERMLAWCDAHLPLIEHKAFRGIDLYLFDAEIGGTVRRTARIVDGQSPVDVYPSAEQPARWEVPAPVPAVHQGGWADGTTVYFDGPLPAASDRQEQVRCIVRPETAGVHTYEYTVYETAQLVETTSFIRQRPDSDLWRINVVWNVSPPPLFFPDTCISAFLDNDQPAQDNLLERKITVEPGQYDVFVHALVEGLPINEHRLRMNVDVDGRKMAPFNSNIPGIDGGWYWVRLGSVSLRGAQPHVVTMSVTKPDNMSKEAYLDMDKFALVPGVGDTSETSEPRLATPPVVASGTVTAAIESPASFRVPVQPYPGRTGQIDVFVVDTATRHEYRIFFLYGMSDAGNGD